MIYIINDEEQEKVKKALADNSIEFKNFDTPLDAFVYEESIYRTNEYEKENNVKFTEECRDTMEGTIEGFLSTNNFLDNDHLCDLVEEAIDNAMDYCKKENLKVFMTREEETKED